uniref:THAP-type domain-containing protein n=1 Tax=Knipowitschia caucasica TaxID=637954 RepID=A0AAV2LEP3_KNICA
MLTYWFFLPSIESTANCGPTLCSQHFSADCFANLVQYQSGYAQRLLLKPDAVPTLHAAAPPNYVMTDSGPASASLRRKKQQRISELLDANDEPGKTDQIDVAGIDFLKPSTAHNGNLILKWQPKVQHCKKKRRHRSEVSMDVSEDDEYRCTSDADKYGTQDNILFDKINVKPAHLKEGPELCVIEEPELCVKEEPELCIDEEPELCVKEEPELCVKEKPELCINEEPELCVKEEPELCVKEEPELCVKEEPELCVKEEPELCVKEEPELCVKEEPELCVKEEPELCINEEPELCVKEEPELCVKEEPELCINEEPELCINEEPELCIKEEPELCVKESEEFPYHVITVKTENSEDKSPVLQRPTDDGEEHSDSFEDTDHSQDYCPEHPPAKRSYAMVPANAFVTDKRPNRDLTAAQTVTRALRGNMI